MANLKKQIKKQIANMPKYEIQDEAFENQTLARARAFGRDRSIQMQEENLEQDASNAIGAAKDVTSSTSGLLSTIAAIQANNTNARRGLAQDEATIQRQNTQDLYQANQSMIDEKDKEWRQNVYAPWDAKLRNLQQRKANKTAFWNNVIGAVGTAAGAVLGGPAGAAIGGGLAKGLTGGGGGGSAPSMEQSMYSSNSRYS